VNLKPAHTVEGIPASLTLQFARDWALPRVSKKRADHVVGVHKVGRDLAIMARLPAVDQFIVELACLLHDACKEYKDTLLVTLAEKYDMKLSPLEKANGHLLHGPVGAFTVREDLALTNKKVLDSISEHTLGNCPMSDISKIVFLADCLEESRPKDYTRPIWQALDGAGGGDDKKKKSTGQKGQVNLDNAMLVALDLGLAHVLESRRAIHPKTVDVRNYFLGIVRAAEK
jgi:predicted HD superfamily hydrolase involved in NAD metabolism